MSGSEDVDWPERWQHVEPFLSRGGPFAHPEFEPSDENLSLIQEYINVLVIGAGGLGCELLKDLALIGFRNIDVIDMDTIDLSNLNRQFLFRKDDIGKPKAQVAADFINKRIPGVKVTPHYAKIQDFDMSFYSNFQLIVCGLDSILARRWINGMVVSMVQYDDDGTPKPESIKPMVDGGTEGFKGNARVIMPTQTPCIECTLDLYPPQINFPMCTIAHTPRLPEHCVEYARVLLWPQEKPFGAAVAIDGDDPDHVQWLYEKAVERADAYAIDGVTYRLTQGVVKRIIPAVASTNAVIAAACATEALKIASSCCDALSNYMNFNDTAGVYTYAFEAERKPACAACGAVPQTLTFADDAALQDVLDHLREAAAFQLKAPGVTTKIDGRNQTLYIGTIQSIEEATRGNLKKSLAELGLVDGQEIYVADPTSPNSLIFRLQITSNMEKD